MSMRNLLNVDLKDFEIPAKHPSEEAQKNWRNLVTLVRNKRRRFRYGPNFEKRTEAKERIEKLRVCLHLSPVLALFFFFFLIFNFFFFKKTNGSSKNFFFPLGKSYLFFSFFKFGFGFGNKTCKLISFNNPKFL